MIAHVQVVEDQKFLWPQMGRGGVHPAQIWSWVCGAPCECDGVAHASLLKTGHAIMIGQTLMSSRRKPTMYFSLCGQLPTFSVTLRLSLLIITSVSVREMESVASHQSVSHQSPLAWRRRSSSTKRRPRRRRTRRSAAGSAAADPSAASAPSCCRARDCGNPGTVVARPPAAGIGRRCY